MLNRKPKGIMFDRRRNERANRSSPSEMGVRLSDEISGPIGNGFEGLQILLG
jgi:hypothetical protein